jgi:hypothetical protein
MSHSESSPLSIWKSRLALTILTGLLALGVAIVCYFPTFVNEYAVNGDVPQDSSWMSQFQANGDIFVVGTDIL